MKKSYSINLNGRVNNFNLPKNKPLVPLFEAIVNSLHAIDEKRKLDKSFVDGKIIITIIRDSQIPMEKDQPLESLAVESFEIYDNGIGFTDDNIQSFLESDSVYKSKLGGKGVGRFSWLKAFSSAHISSAFKKEDKLLKREFDFSFQHQSIEDDALEISDDSKTFTKITLKKYKREYQEQTPKQANAIANQIIQHCLIYFLSNDCPKIQINDGPETILLNKIFLEKFKPDENTDSFEICNIGFKLTNLKIEDATFKGNRLYFCAHNRLVQDNDLEKQISDLDREFFKQNQFSYLGVLTSDYFDNNVNMNRLSLDIPKEDDNLNDKIILNNSCAKIKEYLEEYLFPISLRKQERIKDYVTKEAPQFRHLLKYMAEDISEKIKPNMNEEELNDALFNIKREFDKKAKKEQNELIKKVENNKISFEDYERQFIEQNNKIIAANKSILSDYVIRRKIIIDLLQTGINRKNDGKFNQEKYIHNLIYPMRSDSDSLPYENHNLWLIDEKLSYCRYIYSDEPLSSKERPDILITDNPVAMVSKENDGNEFDTIIIFELKKPMRDDYSDSDNPINQLYNYADKFKTNKLKDPNGRYIKVNDNTKFYLYAVCDITPTLEKIVTKTYDFTPTPDNRGFYGYHKHYKAYIEVLSFDKIINDAKQRNRILFDKLGI